MRSLVSCAGLIYRRAKSKAAQQGIPLRQFVTEAIEDKLKTAHAIGKKLWMKHMGKLKRLHKEMVRINKVIEEAFEEVDPELWTRETGD
jgi:hypothetical protein